MKKKEILAKKLPGLLKKSYSQKALEKKIYKKIREPSDQKLVESLFEFHPEKKEMFSIPRDKVLSQEDFKRLKLISKNIKKYKVILAKKLPGLLKKSYSKKALEKKIYRKIYIPSDQKLLESLFEFHPEKKGKYLIPRSRALSKKDFKRLKLISKDIKRQKATFKLIPFAAVVAIIFAAVTVVVAFKNIIVKKGIISAMQGAFGAKTEISSVNVEILGASITINNLRQANKKSPMKNLFQTDKIEINFNLTEALRGKFDAQNIEVSGLEVNTDRTVSGELPQKKKKQKPAEKKEDSALALAVAEKKQAALNAAKNSINDMFADYNPQTILNELQDNLQSPAVAKHVQEEAEALVLKWKDKPDEIELMVKTSRDCVEKVLDTDWGNIQEPAVIKEAIENVTSAIEQTKSVSKNVQQLANEVKSDSKKIGKLSAEVKEAITSDNELVSKQFAKITSFRIPSGSKVLANMLDSVFYALIGEYYPYAKQAASYAMQAKASSQSAEKKPKKEKVKKQTHARLAGTTVYWKKDRVPRFLIERIHFSGLNLAIDGTEISSDMDKRGQPARFSGSYSAKTQTHKANLLVDTRTVTENELVEAAYSGDNYPFKFSSPYLSMKSSTLLTATGTISNEGCVTLGLKFDIGSLQLSSDKFEPVFAYNLYSSALSYIDSLKMDTAITINGDDKFSLSIDSDLDKKFLAALKKVADAEIKNLIAEAKKEISRLLNEKTNGAFDQISQFINIEDGINRQSIDMEKLNTRLEEKKAELQRQLREKTEEAARKAIKEAEEAAQKAVQEAKQKAEEKIQEELKNKGIEIPSDAIKEQGKDALKNMFKKK